MAKMTGMRLLTPRIAEYEQRHVVGLLGTARVTASSIEACKLPTEACVGQSNFGNPFQAELLTLRVDGLIDSVRK